jgi:hypothetical protein
MVLNSRDPLLPIRIGEEHVDVSRRLPARERCRLDPTGPDGARLRDLIARSPPHGKNCGNRPDQPQLIIEQERLEISGRHEHRQRHRHRSRLCARQHGRDHRIPAGRAGDRIVHRSAARAPQQANGAWRRERREGPDRSGAAKLNESLLVCRSSPERGIPEPIHVWQVCRATSARSATLER